MNVGEDTALGDGDVAKEFVQLLIVPDGELEMARDDTGLLVVTGGVASQLEDFGSEILEHGSEVDGSAGTDTLGVVALAEETVHTTNGERETSLGRTPERDSQKKTRLEIHNAHRNRLSWMITAQVEWRDRVGVSRKGQLTTARSWSQRPYRQTCRRQSF